MTLSGTIPDLLGGHYRVKQLIGSGGLGRVFLAEDVALGRKVAIKALHPGLSFDSTLKERFAREARVVARLNHPSIVSVFETGHDNGLFYIVFEYVDGTDLATRIRDGGLTFNDALTIAIDTSHALLYAHENGVIHRDIKPGNILIDRITKRAKLTDFGIARHFSEAALTRSGEFFGTLRYASPDFIKTTGVLSFKSDVYSLGATFYELFTGIPIYREQDSDFSFVARIISGEMPESPEAVRPDLPSKLSALILRMLEHDPEKRISLSEVVSVLEEVKGEITPEETTPGKSEPKGILVDRHTVTRAISNLDQEAPSQFFASTAFPQTAFFQNETIRFSKIHETLGFYREHLNEEYKSLLKQARLTYYLWVLCVSIGFILLLVAIATMLMGRIQEGIASAASTIILFFIQRVFQQREDHYRSLARAKNDHLEYGNQWLLVIQSIDAIADQEKRALEQSKLVDVLLHKLRHKRKHSDSVQSSRVAQEGATPNKSVGQTGYVPPT